LVIALKFPSYLAPCGNKRVWLLHQFRQAYDLWGTALSGIADAPEGRGLRDLIVRADNTAYGSKSCEYIASHATSPGTIAMVEGDLTSLNARDRAAGRKAEYLVIVIGQCIRDD